MTSSNGDHRPTLPPIRDLFRDEFLRRPSTSSESPSLTLARLRVSDYNEGTSSYYGPERPAPPLHKLPMRHSEPTLGLRPQTDEGDQLYHLHPGARPMPTFQDRPPTFNSISYDGHPSHLRQDSSNSSSRNIFPSAPQIRTSSSRHSGAVPILHQPNDPRSSYSHNAFTRHRSEITLSDPSLRPWNISTSVEGNKMVEDDERTPIGRYVPSTAPQPQQDLNPSSSAKYECQYCGKAFNRPSSLKIHLNSHTGEKPFVCPIVSCGRSFSVLSNMRRHARVHSVVPLQEPPTHGRHESSSSEASSSRWLHRRNSTASTSSASSHRSHSISSDDGDDQDRREKRTRT